MRLFRSRADALVEQHLESIGLDEGWWPAAKAAIACCEQRDWFEPLMSMDGVFAARDLVAHLSLEPFVRGGVDWDAHSDPFLADPNARAFYDDRLDRSAARWDEIYAEDTNPTLRDADLEQALGYLRRATQESPNGGIDLDDRALKAVWSLGSAGYCWRLAEEQVHKRPRSDEFLPEFAAMWDDLPDDPPRSEITRGRLLLWGTCTAANLIQQNENRLCPWQSSPGGFATRFDYYVEAFDWARTGIVTDDVTITKPDLWYAWNFGFALRDSERWLEAHPATN